MGFKREKRNSGAAERDSGRERSSGRSGRSDRGDRGGRSERSSSGGKSYSKGGGKAYPFTNIGSVKQGRNMSDKDAAQLKGCDESVKIKLYMPNVAKLVLEKDAVIGINLGKKGNDPDFILGHVVLPLGSVSPTKKTSEDIEDFLGGFAELNEFDLVAQIYLPKDVETVSLEHDKILLLTFKTGEKAESLDFVLGTLAIANDQAED
jgi:hypothetical protein